MSNREVAILRFCRMLVIVKRNGVSGNGVTSSNGVNSSGNDSGSGSCDGKVMIVVNLMLVGSGSRN